MPNLQRSAANWHPSAPPLSSARWDCHMNGLLGLYSSQFLAPCIRDVQPSTVADWEWTLAFWLTQARWNRQLSHLFSYLFDSMGMKRTYIYVVIMQTIFKRRLHRISRFSGDGYTCTSSGIPSFFFFLIKWPGYKANKVLAWHLCIQYFVCPGSYRDPGCTPQTQTLIL